MVWQHAASGGQSATRAMAGPLGAGSAWQAGSEGGSASMAAWINAQRSIQGWL